MVHTAPSLALTLCASPSSAASGGVHAFARLWRVLRWFWAIVLVGLALSLNDEQLDPAEAMGAGARALLGQPVAMALLLAALLLTWYALVAALYERRARHRALVSTHVLRPVWRLRGKDFVPRYVQEVYLPRRDATDGADADARARVALHTAAHQQEHIGATALGICIFGTSGQGKTRLAWEVARAELSGWRLLRWPHDADPATSLDYAAQWGRRLLLWLDDLHEYANPTEGAAIADLPRRLVSAGAHVVVVATCREGADERRARRHLGGLLERLVSVRLADITTGEADQLVAALHKEYVQVRREQFERTPGSLLLGIRRLRMERFPQLSLDAQRVLRALALLHSAGIYSNSLWRVRLVATEVFGMTPATWRVACDAVVEAGYVRLGRRGLGDEGALEPVSAAYMDGGVPPHLTRNAAPSDDWVALQGVFQRHADVHALLRLGTAFNEVEKGLGPLLPFSLHQEKQRGILCIRAALGLCSLRSAPRAWALAQIELGDGLAARAALTEDILRADCWSQAATAYRAAADILTRAEAAHWALAQARLAHVSEQMASDALFRGDEAAAVIRLRETVAYAENALSHYTPDYDPVRWREALRLRETTQETLRALGEVEDVGG